MIHTVTKALCLTTVICLSWNSLVDAQAITDDTQSQQVKEIIAKLHPGIEPMDNKVKKDREDLVNQGSRIFPGVISILKINDDPMIVGTLAGVVSRMKTDRSPLLPTVREMAKRNEPWAREISAAVIGEIGQPEDTDVLVQMIADPNERVRMASVKSIAKIGRGSDIDRLTVIVQERSKKLTAPEREKDTLLREIKAAIELLHERSLPKK